MYDNLRAYESDARELLQEVSEFSENILAPTSNVLPPSRPPVSLCFVQLHSILRSSSLLYPRTERLGASLLLDIRGRTFSEGGTRVSSIPPSTDRLTCSEGRLVFAASFLLAPNVAPPLRSCDPPWLGLRGAMRTEVNGLAALCCRLASVYSRSRSRSVCCVSH